MFKPSLEVLQDRNMPSFLLPPEINSALMESLELTSGNIGNSGNINTGFFNSGNGNFGLVVAETSATYAGWISAAAAQAQAASTQAQVVAAAYETAIAMTVPPPSVAANRAALATLVATNFLGQNTTAIAATEAQYEEMWAQDAAGMADPAGDTLASPSTGFVSSAADEVSAAVAALFGAHAEMYQALSSQAAVFPEQFIQALNAASGQYASTESANPVATR